MEWFCHYSLVLLLTVNGFLIDEKFQQKNRLGRTLVLGGGIYDDNNKEIYGTIVRLAGGVNHAKLGIVLAASGDFNATCTFYQNVFLDMYHAHSVYCIPINVNNTSANSDPLVIERIKQQTGIFFAGGEPERVIESLFYKNHVPSPALLVIKEMFDTGIIISGSSAGAECMPSAVMVWGGTGSSYNALQFGTYDGSEVSDRDYQLYDKDGGLGLLDGFIIDAHFSDRGREGRLIRLLSDTHHLHHGTDWGFGIDEDTAMVITNVGTENEKAEVIGYKGVFFADVSQSNITAKYHSYSITNVMVHYLTHGDSLFLKNKTMIFSSTKSPMIGFERNSRAMTSTDIFNTNITISHSNEPFPVHYPEFVKVAKSLFDSKLDNVSYGDTYEHNPTFRVYMSRSGTGAKGYTERGQDLQTNDITSYTNLQVNITSLG
ncbi:cyanophycinase-like isoform X1 [Mytilus trossulus]|uniref:cyanophycinase-like isoform X1 n=2 Tax=Mytilus trossulus TaxID=6551 RepID=UPI00300442BC